MEEAAAPAWNLYDTQDVVLRDEKLGKYVECIGCQPFWPALKWPSRTASEALYSTSAPAVDGAAGPGSALLAAPPRTRSDSCRARSARDRAYSDSASRRDGATAPAGVGAGADGGGGGARERMAPGVSAPGGAGVGAALPPPPSESSWPPASMTTETATTPAAPTATRGCCRADDGVSASVAELGGTAPVGKARRAPACDSSSNAAQSRVSCCCPGCHGDWAGGV